LIVPFSVVPRIVLWREIIINPAPLRGLWQFCDCK
jgi:hypothetical protein